LFLLQITGYNFTRLKIKLKGLDIFILLLLSIDRRTELTQKTK